MAIWRSTSNLKYSQPTLKISLFGVGILILAGLVKLFELFTSKILELLGNDIVDFSRVIKGLVYIAIFLFIISVVEYVTRSDSRNIKYIIRRSLCLTSFGNPLHLKDGEYEPLVYVCTTNRGYKITIACPSADFNDVSNLEMVISGSLRNKKYGNYAVTAKEEDLAGRYVEYFIEDVIQNYNKQSVYSSITDVPSHQTRLYIREDVYIDLTSVLNSSTIVAGRSRSGKSTAIISVFILPMLKLGRDRFGSEIIIVDPKNAELSLCPHVLSPDQNGNVEHILEAIRHFNSLRIERQQIINNYCKENGGKAIKWFDIGMNPCLLFLDEFISLQDLFPKKPSKEKPEYCLADFQGLLRQIATQGASAGCFLILSTAEASVGTGGLESAVNNACGIRILFKPSLDEARYLWNSDSLAVMRERQYSAGDAWFSADDVRNNRLSVVKFPRLEFGEYEALSSLLSLYYGNDVMHNAMSEAKERCAVSESNNDKSL